VPGPWACLYPHRPWADTELSGGFRDGAVGSAGALDPQAEDRGASIRPRPEITAHVAD